METVECGALSQGEGPNSPRPSPHSPNLPAPAPAPPPSALIGAERVPENICSRSSCRSHPCRLQREAEIVLLIFNRFELFFYSLRSLGLVWMCPVLVGSVVFLCPSGVPLSGLDLTLEDVAFVSSERVMSSGPATSLEEPTR